MATSIWKRELSLGRKPKRDEPAAEPVAESVAAVPAVPEGTPASAADRIEAYLPGSTDVPPLPPTTGDYGWLTENFDPNDIPAEMPAIAAPPVSIPEPPRNVPPVAAPATIPVPEAAPAEVSAAAPAAAPTVKKPFCKQELTLKRAGKQPKQPKQPKEPKAKKVKKVKQSKAPQEATEAT